MSSTLVEAATAVISVAVGDGKIVKAVEDGKNVIVGDGKNVKGDVLERGSFNMVLASVRRLFDADDGGISAAGVRCGVAVFSGTLSVEPDEGSSGGLICMSCSARFLCIASIFAVAYCVVLI